MLEYTRHIKECYFVLVFLRFLCTVEVSFDVKIQNHDTGQLLELKSFISK